MLELDHLVVVAETLQEGADHIEAALDVRLSPGGKHDFMGTHNLLLSLGPNAYLEVIAVDPSGANPVRPRWFDLDNFAGAPKLANWICRSSDLDTDMARAPDGLGPAQAAARGDLSWRITLPDDGCLPFDGLFPGLIHWNSDAHPAQNLPDLGLRLEKLELCHPKGQLLSEYAQEMFDMDDLSVQTAPEPRMIATLSTPLGPRLLQ